MIEPLKNVLYVARRYKLLSALNFLGLIVAFAAFFLIMTQIIYQHNYNREIEDYQRLYRLDTNFNNRLYSDEIYFPFADVLNQLPEVESISLVSYIDNNPAYRSYYEYTYLTKEGEQKKFLSAYPCNKTAVSTLTSHSTSGDLKWRGNTIRGEVIIPESIAKEYFESVNVVNDTMTYLWDDSTHIKYIVRGVYQDFPENSELSNCVYFCMKTDSDYKYSFNPAFKCIVKFKHIPADVDAVNKRLKQGILDEMEKGGREKYADAAEMSVSGLQKAVNDMDIRLTPLKDSYFASKTLSSGKHGFRPMLYILCLASILLIIIASIHFLNFTLVESPMRIRGINTRLVLGATRRTLKLGIIAECIITAVMACIIALIICEAISSWSIVNRLTEGSLAPHKHWLLALVTLIIAGIVGFAAGLHPSTFVTSFAPAMALKGNFGLTPQGHKLRKTIIAFQLFISFLMVIYMGILLMEQHYIYHSDYGYNKDKVLMSTVPLYTSEDAKQQLHKKLTAIPGVKDVSFSDGALGLSDTRGPQLVEFQGHNLSYELTNVDSAYMRAMGFNRIIEGRDFKSTDTAAAIVNKAAKQQWDWLEMDMKIPLVSGDSITVIGVCDSIRYNTTRLTSDQPFLIVFEPEGADARVHLNLGMNDNLSDADCDVIRTKADSIIQKQLRDTTGLKTDQKKLDILNNKYPTLLETFDTRLKDAYEVEFRSFKWILILSVICTVITLIGVFCLTMFESEYRRKEIGIRKIAGATTGEVVKMLCLQYIPLILISFAIALPIAWLCGYMTLTHFEENVGINWWMIPIALAALVIVGGVVMAIILIQSWRTARENPVNSIKSE